MKLSIKLAALAAATATFVMPSFATSITGEANVGGTATVGLSSVTFSQFTVGSPNTGSFMGLTSYTLMPLSGVAGTLATPVMDYGIFNVAAGTIHFDLTTIAPGYGTLAGCSSNAAGSMCTPTGTPFTLTQEYFTVNGASVPEVSVTMSVGGDAFLMSSSTGSSPVVAGLFTTQNLAAGTITGILDQVLHTGSFTDTYSATFIAETTAVPEPASMLLAGIGLLGAGLIARRKAAK